MQRIIDTTWLLYVDAPRELVDVAEYDGGAVGSNWMVVGSEADAHRIMQEYLDDGFAAGHWSSPTF